MDIYKYENPEKLMLEDGSDITLSQRHEKRANDSFSDSPISNLAICILSV
ncbi:MAG: hypothetical protein ACYCPR_05415 [Thermoplasmataceae archaeon]